MPWVLVNRKVVTNPGMVLQAWPRLHSKAEQILNRLSVHPGPSIEREPETSCTRDRLKRSNVIRLVTKLTDMRI